MRARQNRLPRKCTGLDSFISISRSHFSLPERKMKIASHRHLFLGRKSALSRAPVCVCVCAPRRAHLITVPGRFQPSALTEAFQCLVHPRARLWRPSRNVPQIHRNLYSAAACNLLLLETGFSAYPFVRSTTQTARPRGNQERASRRPLLNVYQPLITRNTFNFFVAEESTSPVLKHNNK